MSDEKKQKSKLNIFCKYGFHWYQPKSLHSHEIKDMGNFFCKIKVCRFKSCNAILHLVNSFREIN